MCFLRTLALNMNLRPKKWVPLLFEETGHPKIPIFFFKINHYIYKKNTQFLRPTNFPSYKFILLSVLELWTQQQLFEFLEILKSLKNQNLFQKYITFGVKNKHKVDKINQKYFLGIFLPPYACFWFQDFQNFTRR